MFRLVVCTCRGGGVGGRGLEEGGWRKSYGGEIGLISIIYTKTPHIDMDQIN